MSYIIQFTRYRRQPLIAVSLLILTQLLPFVKNFFHFSANFYFAMFSRPDPCRSKLDYDTKRSSICQVLFSRFLNLFVGAWRSSLKPDRLYHISFRLSSTFFRFFSNFRFSSFVFAVSRRQLAYTSTDNSICQALFFTFFIF